MHHRVNQLSKVLAATCLIGAIALPAWSEGDHDHSHHGAPREVPASLPAPTLALAAFEDTESGYNLQLIVENFAFSPSRTGTYSDDIEGHAHLYINEVKVGRVYGEWFHLPAGLFAEGDNEIRVTLNDNMHSDWAVAGAVVEDIVEVHVHASDGHDH